MAHRPRSTCSSRCRVSVATNSSPGACPPQKSPSSRISPTIPGPGVHRGGYALYAGRLSGEKGVAVLLDAWRQIGGRLKLRIIGDGPMADAVAAAAAENAAIDWRGAAPLEAVYDALGDAAFVVAPSRCYENFPRIIAEAFARGAPVVTADIGAMAEIVEDGRTGLHFRAGDASDLARKCLWLAGNDSSRAQMSVAARQAFLRDYTAAANHATTMGVYARALACAAARRGSTAPVPADERSGARREQAELFGRTDAGGGVAAAHRGFWRSAATGCCVSDEILSCVSAPAAATVASNRPQPRVHRRGQRWTLVASRACDRGGRHFERPQSGGRRRPYIFPDETPGGETSRRDRRSLVKSVT